MTRFRMFLSIACIAGLTLFPTNSWTQDSRDPRETPAQKADGPRVSSGGASAPFRPRLEVGTDSGSIPAGTQISIPGYPAASGFGGGGGPAASGFGMGGGFFQPVGQVSSVRPKIVTRTINETILVPVSDEEFQQFQTFQNAIQAIKVQKDQEAVNDAMKKVIPQFLNKQFDEDTAQRETELTSVAERVTSLRQQLDKRKQAQEQIISLRLKTIINDAEGLGFPSNEAPQQSANASTSGMWSMMAGMSGRGAGMGAMSSPQPMASAGSGGSMQMSRGTSQMGKMATGMMSGGMMGGRAASGPTKAKTVSRTVQEVITVPLTADEIEQIDKFQESIAAVKDAKDEAAKKTASETIRKHLVAQFEQDLKQRETELESVEERVKLLKQQLEKRKASKSEIIELRLKTIVANAMGLGFPGDDDSLGESQLGDRPVQEIGLPTFTPLVPARPSDARKN